jgi:hypothetical protein
MGSDTPEGRYARSGVPANELRRGSGREAAQLVLSSGSRARGNPAAALNCAPLVLAESAPDTGVLATLERPLQARLHDLAPLAHLLGLVDLE